MNVTTEDISDINLSINNANISQKDREILRLNKLIKITIQFQNMLKNNINNQGDKLNYIHNNIIDDTTENSIKNTINNLCNNNSDLCDSITNLCGGLHEYIYTNNDIHNNILLNNNDDDKFIKIIECIIKSQKNLRNVLNNQYDKSDNLRKKLSNIRHKLNSFQNINNLPINLCNIIDQLIDNINKDTRDIDNIAIEIYDDTNTLYSYISSLYYNIYNVCDNPDFNYEWGDESAPNSPTSNASTSDSSIFDLSISDLSIS